MSPKEARVFIIDDNSIIRELYSRGLSLFGGHTVVGEAATEREAVAAIPRLAELGVQVILLDSNLGIGGRGAGQRLLPQLRAVHPRVAIINFGAEDIIPGVDVPFRKGIEDGGPQELARIITDL